MSKIIPTLSDHIKTTVTALGYEFVGCELLSQGRHSLLRIYIDSKKGVTLDDCSRVSNQVSALLDVEDPISGQYTLEVSSPGLNRPLFELAHYQKQIGKQIKIRLRAPLNGQRNFVGLLACVNEQTIFLSVEGQEIILPFSNVEKANLYEEINQP